MQFHRTGLQELAVGKSIKDMFRPPTGDILPEYRQVMAGPHFFLGTLCTQRTSQMRWRSQRRTVRVLIFAYTEHQTGDAHYWHDHTVHWDLRVHADAINICRRWCVGLTCLAQQLDPGSSTHVQHEKLSIHTTRALHRTCDCSGQVGAPNLKVNPNFIGCRESRVWVSKTWHGTTQWKVRILPYVL